MKASTFSVEKELAREIYKRLISQGWRKIEKVCDFKRLDLCERTY